MRLFFERYFSHMPDWFLKQKKTRTLYFGKKDKPPNATKKVYEISGGFRDEFVSDTVGPVNPLNIPLISDELHSQIFPGRNRQVTLHSDFENIKKAISHLNDHNINTESAKPVDRVSFNLPRLQGENIEEHFRNIAFDYIRYYKKNIDRISTKNLPVLPDNWKLVTGWTKYCKNGEAVMVSCPDEQAYLLDVEVLVQHSPAPVIAVAASCNSWYSWCSPSLEMKQVNHKELNLEDLIPVMSQNVCPRIIIGHNVSYDRARISDQYNLKCPNTRFLDTMSLHIAVSGMTTYQRALLMGAKKKDIDLKKNFGKIRAPPLNLWTDISCKNSLADIYQFYNPGKLLEKDQRNVFVRGCHKDVVDDFQNLMMYCARDVVATHNILTHIWPQFLTRFSHPVTLAGMLEMSVTYLPVNQNWEHYCLASKETFDDLNVELKKSLMNLADDACQLLHDDKYKKNLWLWDLDWSVKHLKPKTIDQDNIQKYNSKDSNIKEWTIFKGHSLTKRQKHMPGFPSWYIKLCPKRSELEGYGPSLISSSMKVTPKLLNLTWKDYPLQNIDKCGWSYVVPDIGNLDEHLVVDYPIQALIEHCNNFGLLRVRRNDPEHNVDEVFDFNDSWDVQQLDNLFEESLDVVNVFDEDYFIPGVIPGCRLYKLPHKNGPQHNVGNPLSKDFLCRIEDGTLKSSSDIASLALKISQMISYWRNHSPRILGQIVLWFDKTTEVTSRWQHDKSGAILPQTIISGTITRRAVEPTWMTATNAQSERVGSELKSMIQAPSGYCFVGADVDSQELWIAGVISDSHFAKLHGASAFGWMTLQGNKSDGTDLHSKTADLIGISRSQAKVMNYARIYGAGKIFAKQLLLQFNGFMTEEEASSKAHKIYCQTKGTKKYLLNEFGENMVTELGIPCNGPLTLGQVRSLKEEALKSSSKDLEDLVLKSVWEGGTESHMFNKLEEIATSKEPKTPFLDARITKALEPRFVDDNFMTSRVNWVVQSSAVDYLHLMLASMAYLCSKYRIDARFSISIHDEVRYLVSTNDKYRAALALQVTNVWVRAFFASKLGMDDLPESVAFFSAVEIDSVLRKEVNMDCVTPSNPYGLQKGYGINPGESLNIQQVLEKTNCGKL